MDSKDQYYEPKPTKLYYDTLESIRLLLDNEGLDKTIACFAQAVSDAFENKYLEENDLRPSSVQLCVHRFLGKKCNNSMHEIGTGCLPPATNHLSVFKKNRKIAAFTSQPYKLNFNILKEIIAYCEKNHLEVNLLPYSSHYPCKTFHLEYKAIKPDMNEY